MKQKQLLACLVLLLTSVIWGFAFVAQRMSVAFLPSFAFNGIRFLLGAVSLLPVILHFRKRFTLPVFTVKTALCGLAAGTALFVGASLQQVGLEHTSAGKAGFLTDLYIVMLSLVDIVSHRRIRPTVLLGALLASGGIFLISVTGRFTMAPSDLLEIAGAVFWTVQILLIDRFARQINALGLALFQFLTCSFLSLLTSAFFETVTFSGIRACTVPLLYGGLLSVGVAYTLQIIGQRYAPPVSASILMSMESVFAALGGFLLLNENLGTRAYLGCALMAAAIVLSQLPQPRRKKPAPAPVEKSGGDVPCPQEDACGKSAGA